jgi:hypothetical protein
MKEKKNFKIFLFYRKVFNRFGLNVPENVMRGACIGKQGLVEMFLYNLRTKIDELVFLNFFN